MDNKYTIPNFTHYISSVKPIKTKKLLNEVLSEIENFNGFNFHRNYNRNKGIYENNLYNVSELNKIIIIFINSIDFNKIILDTKHVAKIVNMFSHIIPYNQIDLNRRTWFKTIIENGYIPTEALIKCNNNNLSYEDFKIIINKLGINVNRNLIFENINIMLELFHHDNKFMKFNDDNQNILIERFNKIDNFIKEINVNIDDAFIYTLKLPHYYKPLFNLDILYANILYYKTYKNISTSISTIYNIKTNMLNLYKILPSLNILYEKINKNKLEQMNRIDFLICVDTPVFFENIYNDEYDEELVDILSIFIDSSNIYKNIFMLCLNKANKSILTQSLFELYCKIGNLEIIEIFLENKFIPTDDLVLRIYSEKIIDIIKLFNKYNYYITEKCFEYIWTNFYTYINNNSNGFDNLCKLSIYVNNEDEFKKFIPELTEKYTDYCNKNSKLYNVGKIYRFYNFQPVKITDIINCNNDIIRKELYEIYLKQNIKEDFKEDFKEGNKTVKKVIRKVIKKSKI